jgi:hypothetical protein
MIINENFGKKMVTMFSNNCWGGHSPAQIVVKH